MPPPIDLPDCADHTIQNNSSNSDSSDPDQPVFVGRGDGGAPDGDSCPIGMVEFRGSFATAVGRCVRFHSYISEAF
eukprot:7120141-Prymnesium_polylepis.1